MRVLIVNTSEQIGGAAVAANRLMEALRAAGVTAEMAVMHKQSDKPYVIQVGSRLRRKWAFLSERLGIWISNRFSRKYLFKVSTASAGLSVTSLPAFQEADIIHLNWVNQGMLSLKEIDRILHCGKPVVWTMHDMWECTAICHHAYQCRRFETQCQHCPYLRVPGTNDLSVRVFRKKQQLLQEAKVHFVAVSTWLQQKAMQSRLLSGLPVSVIPNTLSMKDFTMYPAAESRKICHLPSDKKIILFGAARIDDPIKGFPLFLKSLDRLVSVHPELASQIHLVLFGHMKQPEWFRKITLPYTYMGSVNSTDRLSRLYASADVLVSASYYETFGQTLIEAQACGCLPVSFGNSGQSGIIRHLENGYLADYLSEESLAEGIWWAFTEGAAIPKASLREYVKQKYDIAVVASAYQELYTNLMRIR